MNAVVLILLLMAAGCGRSVLVGDSEEEDQSTSELADDSLLNNDLDNNDILPDETEIDMPTESSPITWARVYKGSLDGRSLSEEAYSILQLADGGYIISGDADDYLERLSSRIIKLDDIGNLLWQKVYRFGEVFWGSLIQQTLDGGYIVGGTFYFSESEGTDILLLKLDQEGGIVSGKIYGGEGSDGVLSIHQTSDGGTIAAGATDSFGSGGHDAWVVKLDDTGAVSWQKAYGSTYDDWASSVRQTSDGGYIACGIFNNGNDAWVIRLDGSGEIAWQKRFVTRFEDQAFSVRETIDGGHIVAAKTDSFGDILDIDNTKIWLIKFDAGGGVLWQKIYDGAGEDVPKAVLQTSDGGYIVAGYTDSFGAGAYDFLVLKLDAVGNMEWQKTYGGQYLDIANDVDETMDGNFIVAGYIDNIGIAHHPSYWVLKMDRSGNISADCPPGIGQDSFLTIEEISLEPEDTAVVPVETNAVVEEADVTLIDTECIVETQCSG